MSLVSPTLAGRFFTTSPTWEVPWLYTYNSNAPYDLFMKIMNMSNIGLVLLTINPTLPERETHVIAYTYIDFRR